MLNSTSLVLVIALLLVREVKQSQLLVLVESELKNVPKNGKNS